LTGLSVMRETIGFVLFVATFVALCGLCNYYVFWRFSGFFGFKRGAAFWGVVVLLTLSYILSIWIHDFVPGRLTVLLHEAAGLWLGVGFLFFSALVVFEVLKYLIKVPPPVAGTSILVVVLGLTCYAMYNASIIRINEVDIAAPVEMRIAHLSDIHLDSDGDRFLRRIVEKTNACAPDVVLITGDMIEPRSGMTAKTLMQLDELSAPAFFVIGNHERYAGMEHVMELFAATKVRVLRNEAVEFGDVQIIGIDDDNNPAQVAKALEHIAVDPARYTVLMYHRPQGFEDAAEAGVGLMLAGHTHNGQIVPFNLIVRLAFRRIKGLHRYGDSFMMVSVGTGTWGPKMRLGSRNEIVMLRLGKMD